MYALAWGDARDTPKERAKLVIGASMFAELLKVG
jgi:hypothetical protein